MSLWILKSAKIGKMPLKEKVEDVKTRKPALSLQFIVRYQGYYVSALPLGLGFIWIAFDKKKQGWHDKIVCIFVVGAARSFPHLLIRERDWERRMRPLLA